MFLVFLVVAVVLVGGCVGGESTPPSDQPVLSPPQGTVTYLTPQEAFALIQENSNNPDFVIIDVRSAERFAAGHIKGAVNLSGTVRDVLNELDKSKIYLTYCPDGCRAPARRMEAANFQRIYDITGGYNGWVSEGLPIVQ